MISANDELKIIDFGLSKHKEELNTLKTKVGSLVYTAPEVLTSNVYGKTCDVWSLGVILHFMLSGKFPFEGENALRDIIQTPLALY